MELLENSVRLTCRYGVELKKFQNTLMVTSSFHVRCCYTVFFKTILRSSHLQVRQKKKKATRKRSRRKTVVVKAQHRVHYVHQFQRETGQSCMHAHFAVTSPIHCCDITTLHMTSLRRERAWCNPCSSHAKGLHGFDQGHYHLFFLSVAFQPAPSAGTVTLLSILLNHLK